MSLQKYLLHLADNAYIHNHRLSEWCGVGPELEIDIALSNIALDNIGAARSFYQYCATLDGGNATEDTIVFNRNEREYLNVKLVELPNGDFATTIVKCLFFDVFQKLLYTKLQTSSDAQIAAIATKSLKEVTYHLRFSSEWTIRLGDGTPESKVRMQKAVDDVFAYAGELFAREDYEQIDAAYDCASLEPEWTKQVQQILDDATLLMPEGTWHHSGGKKGMHTEHMGYILSEMQYLNRAFPGAEW
jgi:ring-1,2-phenylacetyl-CoA epoxidase subunit PaaC